MIDRPLSRHGRNIPVSVARRLIIDSMWASRKVPIIHVIRRVAIPNLVAVRRKLVERPAWPAIFGKAFAMVAAETPQLRRAFFRWPWPRFHEFPESTIAIAIDTQALGNTGVMTVRIRKPEAVPAKTLSADLRRATADPLASKSVRLMVKTSRYPFFIRRLLWWACVNIPRMRRHAIGTFGLTSVAHLGATLGRIISPASFVLTYGPLQDDGSLEVGLSFDHRIIDGALAARALARLEEILNSSILAELR